MSPLSCGVVSNSVGHIPCKIFTCLMSDSNTDNEAIVASQPRLFESCNNDVAEISVASMVAMLVGSEH